MLRTVRIPIVLFWVVCLVWPAIALGDHTVRPLVVDLELEPRDQVQRTVTITNKSERTQRVYATVNAVAVDGDDVVTEFTTPAASDSRITPTSWFEVSRARIEIPPNEQYELPVRVHVHPQAEPGVYHVLLGVAAARNRPIAQEQVLTGTAPGTLFRISIADDRTAYLQLRDFSAGRLVSNVLASNFTFQIENPSDTALIPEGELIVYDSRGREMTSFAINTESQVIEPGEVVDFTIPMNDSLAWGRNRAQLSLTYGAGQRANLNDTVFFFRIPLFWLLVIFSSLLLVSILIAFIIHRRYVPAHALQDDADQVPVTRRLHPTREAADHDVTIHATTDDQTHAK